MTRAWVQDGTLIVSFTTGEKIAGLVRDQHIPLDKVRTVEVVPNGLSAVNGLRALGLAVPGRNKIGTWRSREGKWLVAVQANKPAIKMGLTAHRYGGLLLTTDAPDELATCLWTTLAARGSTPATTTQSRAVSVQSGQHTLSGTLTVPAGEGPFPAVLLLPGSGPVDRDSNHKRMPLGITGQLADALDSAGLATLRYDKRGVGASTGNWGSTGFYNNRDDASAALEFLASYPGVDRTRLLILGHSEGALHAASLAAGVAEADAASGKPHAAGVVLLSGSAPPGEALLRWQAAQIAPTLPRVAKVMLRLMRTNVEARAATTHARVKATTADESRVAGSRVNARWLREFMEYDPRLDLSRIAVPVLAITGGKDLQVPASDLAIIAGLVGGPIETHELPSLSHILRTQFGPASLSAYKDEMQKPVDPNLIELVVAWVRGQVCEA